MQSVILDIGCGANKASRDYIGVDRLALQGVDVVCDLERSLPFATSSIDSIVTRHTLEHIHDLEGILREFHRIVKPGGSVLITVPHFSNTLGFSDYTHKRFFGYYTFDYFSRTSDPHWNVPRYTNDISFHIVRKRLCFRNFSVFSRLLEALFNRSRFAAYFYESKLSWIVPCFEIEFELKVEKAAQASEPCHALGISELASNRAI